MTTLLSFVREYPYLGTAVMVLLLCLGGCALFPSQRQAVLRSGILALPWGLWGISLVPEYWRPRLLVQVGDVGLEDFVWAFSTGGLTWLAAMVPARRRLRFEDDLRLGVRRYAMVSLVGTALFVPAWLGGIGVMNAFVLGVVGVGCLAALQRPDLWRRAACGAIVFGILNVLVMKAIVAIQPAYYAQLSPGAVGHAVVWGLPLEEVAWSVVTGAVWPWAVCYVRGAAPLGDAGAAFGREGTSGASGAL